VIGFSAVTPLTLAPLLGRVPYDAERDLAPVMAVMRTPVLIVGTPALPAQDMAGMLAWARASKAGVRWASSGVGTTGHMVLERVARAAAIRVTHVPYTGGGRQLSDAIGGQFELLSTNVAPTPLRHVRQGRLVPLAVTGTRRLPGLPQVPTLAELGLAQADLVSTFGVFAPAGLLPGRLARLNAALAAALRASAVPALLAAADNEVLGGTPQDFARLIADDRAAHRAWLAGRR
jgi:tripartite-type tricarboxylate transporter receptor subunit TctC